MAQLYAWVAGILLVGGALISFWFSIHINPLNAKDKVITKQKEVIVIYENKINNLSTGLAVCKSKTEAIGFEAYFEGGGGIEESNSSNNGNIFLKRMRTED